MFRPFVCAILLLASVLSSAGTCLACPLGGETETTPKGCCRSHAPEPEGPVDCGYCETEDTVSDQFLAHGPTQVKPASVLGLVPFEVPSVSQHHRAWTPHARVRVDGRPPPTLATRLSQLQIRLL